MPYKPVSQEDRKIYIEFHAEHFDEDKDVVIGRFIATKKRPKKSKKKK